MTSTKATSDSTSTSLLMTELGTTEPTTSASDQAISMSDTTSLPPRASVEPIEMEAESLVERNTSGSMNSIDDPQFQPKQPTRSLTLNQATFARVTEVLEDALRSQSSSEQPMILNFGHIERIEIVNGSMVHPYSSSPTGAASVVKTIPESKPGQNILRPFPRITQTRSTALEKCSAMWDWISKFSKPKPKPFTVTCNVRDVDNKLKALEVLLDTGSSAGNIIPYFEVKALGLLERIKPSPVPHINGIGEGTIKIDGTLEIVGKWDGSQERSTAFYVVNKDDKFASETILGAESISVLKLLRMRVIYRGHSITPNKKEGKEEQENLASINEDIKLNDAAIEKAAAKQAAAKQAAMKKPKQGEETAKLAATKDGNALTAGNATKAGDDPKNNDTSKARNNPKTGKASGS